MKRQIAIMIDAEVKDMLDKLCKLDDRSQAKLISKLIRSEYERINKGRN